MRKTLVLLAILGLLALAVSAQAVTTTTVTMELYSRTNMICASIIPFYPHLWDDAIGDAANPGCFLDWMADPGFYASSYDTLGYLDPVTQNGGSFPDILLDHPILMGEGYCAWVWGDNGPPIRQITYSGVDISDTDAWISLPGRPAGNGGLHLIGIPYPVGTTVDWGNIIVTDGVQAYTLMNLIGDNNNLMWGDFEFSSVDAPSQNGVGVPSQGDLTLYGGMSYYLYTTVSNLALILPSPQ